MHTPAVLIAAALCGFLAPVQAQEKPSAYRVELNIRDGIDGKPHPSMQYTMLIDDSRRAVFQAASRVPIEGGTPGFVDVGVNIELTARASGGKVTLDGAIDLTSITGYANFGGSLTEPIIGQRKIAFNRTVELDRPTIIVDDRPAGFVVTGPLASAQVTASDQPPSIAAMHQVVAIVTRVN